jgi:phosphatidylglycerol:prolipoprotein diacylglycerol transferase
MIPFVFVPDFHVGPLTLHPFGILVTLAVLVGTSLATARAKKVGVDPAELSSFATTVVVCGFVGGHVIDALLYTPREVLERPLQLFAIWRSQGSFGGFIGATLGAFAWKHFETRPWQRILCLEVPRIARRAEPRRILPLADVLLAVFPVAWIFGRMGCALAHDHPGIRAALGSPFAVATGAFDPNRTLHGPLGTELRFGDAPRYDLGTLELFFTLALAGATVLTWRRPRAPGFYVTFVPLAYAPVRFALDFLRVGSEAGGDVRYGGLTPAQWCCVAIVLVRVGLQHPSRQSAGSATKHI